MTEENPVERLDRKFERSYSREYSETFQELSKTRKYLCRLNMVTPIVAPLAGAFLGYEFMNMIGFNQSEYPNHNLIMNVGGIGLGLSLGWFGGIGLCYKLSGLINPKARRIQKRFEKEFVNEFQEASDYASSIPKIFRRNK